MVLMAVKLRTHNRLLHGGLVTRNDFADDRVNHGPEIADHEPERALVTKMGHSESRNVPASPSTEGERRFLNESSLTTTVMTSKPPEQAHFVALRTVPVVAKNEGRRLVLNALLDDANTKTYKNGDVAAELGLERAMQKITVNVLNGGEDSFQTMPVEFDLQGVDGRTNVRISAYTASLVTGNMRPVNWKVQAAKWEDLQGINFPDVGSRSVVDILLGINYAELHYSFKDTCGQPGEPMARLTPLGWTYIGAADVICWGTPLTYLNMAYFVLQQEMELASVLQKFWEIETCGSETTKERLRPEEELAIKGFENSVQFKEGR